MNELLRVLRGGSWLRYPDGLRVAYRRYGTPPARRYFLGFRLVVRIEGE